MLPQVIFNPFQPLSDYFSPFFDDLTTNHVQFHLNSRHARQIPIRGGELKSFYQVFLLAIGFFYILFSIPHVYPSILQPPEFASGAIQSMEDNNLCIDTLNRQKGEAVGE